jgi:D-alanyl-lipoteichoic acid acyltransferase DltB (MBOAT superfamily)
MLFNSLAFLLFLPIVAVGYFFLTMRIAKRRKALSNTLSQFFLLAASLFFYGYWNISYLALILISVTVTWASGILMEGRKVQEKRFVLIGSLIINLGILFFFKYYGFFTNTIGLLSRGGIKFPAFDVLLPVGISFYTFQALGYSIDIYYGKVQAERNFISYALFVTFFPGLMAGPIERTGNLLPQFKVNHEFDYDRVTSGLRLAAWGMFKKVMIADRLAIYVSAVFEDPGIYPASSLALAVFFFSFQVYCDFSGYSDIAIGCARVLGFNLMTNFRQPYLSRSIAEYWRRWHISLSTWLRDYIYIPLGGNRKGRIRQDINTMIVFVVCGIWHGAAWNFVVFGAIQGMYLIIGKRTALLRNAIYRKIGLPEESRLRKAIQICFTFLLLNFGYIVFRGKSIADSLFIMVKLTKLPAELIGYVRGFSQIGIIGTVREAFQLGSDVAAHIANFGLIQFGISIILICILILSDILLEKAPEGTAIARKLPFALRWAGYYAIVLMLLLRWNMGTAQQFVYFVF